MAKLATRAMTNAQIKQHAAYRAAGLIQTALDTGTVIDNLVEFGLRREDAERVEAEMCRIVARLEGKRESA